MKNNMIALTMGDPAGVGPEIIVRAWSKLKQIYHGQIIVYGIPDILQYAADLFQSNLHVVEIERGKIPLVCSDSIFSSDDIFCVQCAETFHFQSSSFRPCVVDSHCGEAAYQAILAATQDALSGVVDAIVTSPIHKEALNLAGHYYPGHTEILAELCGQDDFAMMLYLGPEKNRDENNYTDDYRNKNGLAVVHVTLHCAMKTIFEQITIESVLAKTRLIDKFMRRIMADSDSCLNSHFCNVSPKISDSQIGVPRIGVCSLNPHAGESGLFGDEEIRIIRPAVELAQKDGICVTGPLPADTIMVNAKNGEYDAIVAMFHDQGHISLKLLGMHRAVNITLGLPIIRTSVAHGTAFDKAWKGVAETGSLIEAVNVAAKLIGK
ncbi:MAG: 4-hydroxythreonine-4-phosphate dehydrogenase PdxA [Thermoguttaceae bacterium]